MAANNSFLVEITGQTAFHLGNPSAPIAVDIAVGYRSRITENSQKESFLYATLTSENKNGISVQDIINCCTTKQEVIPEILNAVSFKQFSVTYGSCGMDATEFKIEFNCKININGKSWQMFKAK